MKVSEIVDDLKELIDRYGDLEVTGKTLNQISKTINDEKEVADLVDVEVPGDDG